MKKLRKSKIIWLAVLMTVAVIIAGSAVGVYAWFQAEMQVKVIYEIPTDNTRIIKFDSVVTKDVRGTLFPAVIDENAVADNDWDNPARIVTEAGRVSYQAQFTMYSGTSTDGDTEDTAPKAIRIDVRSAAKIVDGQSERDLVQTGELETLFDFTIAGTKVRLNAKGELFINLSSAPRAWFRVGSVAAGDYTAYVEGGEVKAIKTTAFVPSTSKTVFVQNGYIIIMTDTPVAVVAEIYLTTPDVITAKDLKGKKVRVALSVVCPDLEEGN